MNFRTYILMGSAGLVLSGCAGISNLGSDPMKNYSSVQEMIAQKNLNAANGGARSYVYDWGTKSDLEPQAMYPRKYTGSYCQLQGGKLVLLHRSTFSQVRDSAQKKRLMANSHVKQGIGAYKCNLPEDSWIVSIEPYAESRQSSGAREVSLLTKVMSLNEARQFYKNAGQTANTTDSRKSSTQVTKAVTAKTAVQKDAEDKKEQKPAPDVQEKTAVRVAETPQQQQLKAYVAARRDLSKGQNQNNACNNAQRAYNFGKLPGTSANVYVDSGMLVAKCLTSVSAYSNRFPNSKAQATRILENLANNYNHAGAKNMLRQLK
ncbi:MULTISPECIES: hypothetical protein [Acinetobacter]|nr:MULTISPECIES: hypothetical protein [Acinetobacter]